MGSYYRSPSREAVGLNLENLPELSNEFETMTMARAFSK